MRVAVTGVMGYLGRRVAYRLMDEGHEVSGLFREVHTPVQQPANSIVVGDMRDPSSLQKLVQGADAIVHAAAYVHRAADTPKAKAECFEVNDHGTRHLVEAAAASGRKPHFVMISSTAVYGATFHDVAEDATPQPVTAYGQSKLAAERHVLDAVRAGTITGCVLRPTVVYGTGAPGNTRRLVDLVRRGRPIPRVRQGINRKSMVDIDDVVGVIVRVLERRDTSSRTFNVAGDSVTVTEMVEAIGEGLGVRPRWVTMPAWVVDAMADATRIASRATAGALPDLSRIAEAFVGEATVDATAIKRDLGIDFRPTLTALRDMAHALNPQFPRASTADRPSAGG